MDLSQASIVFALITTLGYAVLLAAFLVRFGWHQAQLRWLAAFTAASIVWQLLFLPFPMTEALPELTHKVLLVNTLLLGMTTALYVDWPRGRLWLMIGGLSALATVVLDVIFPGNMPAPIADLPFGATAGDLAAFFVWMGLSASVLTISWTHYQKARLPGHANRLLYWSMTLLLAFLGEGLLFFGHPGPAIIGFLLRLLGVVGMVFAVASYRIFDVRTRLRRMFAFFLIALTSGGLATAILLLISRMTARLPVSYRTGILVAVFAAVILVYQPFYRLQERVLSRYLFGEEFETARALRTYSQAIARTLDVEQLSLVIIGTISELLETSRGCLWLVSEADGRYAIDPVRAMGAVSTERVYLDIDSLLLRTLLGRRQPLLQYDIDFDPHLQEIGDDEQSWLAGQAMDVYVPISTDDDLIGIIALGPKSSGLTYRSDELELLQVVADQTVVALQNARLYSEMGRQNDQIRLLNTDLRQQNERLAIMDQVKSDFITIASHELRTPLTQVMGYADILQAMNKEASLTRAQTDEIVSHINRATIQLERLIAAMLDASQLDVDGMVLRFAETNLEAVLRLAVEPLAEAISERRITLKSEGVDKMPKMLADFQRLVQAFQNLIGNAVKYTPDGGLITVTASLIEDELARDYIEVVIADTGIGIDPKYHNLIFEKFFRVGNPQLHSTGYTKFKGAGPGLGLPIAQGVIETHGGRIWVESAGEDEERLPGSSFHIILPLVPPAAEGQRDGEAVAFTERQPWPVEPSNNIRLPR